MVLPWGSMLATDFLAMVGMLLVECGWVWLGMSWVSEISSGRPPALACGAVFDPHLADRATGADLVSLALRIAVNGVR